MDVYSQLRSAQLENKATNPSSRAAGLVYFNTATLTPVIDTGSRIANLGSIVGIAEVNADYTVLDSIDTVLVDTSAGNVVITLPSLGIKREIKIIKIDSSENTVSVETPVGVAIDYDPATGEGVVSVLLERIGDKITLQAATSHYYRV